MDIDSELSSSSENPSFFSSSDSESFPSDTEDEDNELQNRINEPWQCGLPSPKERVLALYKNGNFTDITLTFPSSEITYDAHRLILAISSPVFEGILFGPMRKEGQNILIHDDDPLIMKYVIAHCYGENLKPPDMDTALEAYILADKYILDSLKKDCCKHIVDLMSPENNKDVIEFAERFNFTDLKSKCLTRIKEMFAIGVQTKAFDTLMGASDPWIECLLSEVRVRVLDFHESLEYPEIPLNDNRLQTILSSKGCYLEKFYGCIKAESMQHFNRFHLASILDNYSNRCFGMLELNLSVTDPHHAKRVIEAITQQDGFVNNLIALHIRCEELWPINWSPIPPERTHRPSLLLIFDTDDDKTSWIVEAAKAFLPKFEGSYTERFKPYRNTYNELKKANILCLPRSQFTPNGFINMLRELSISGVNCYKIYFESPNISKAHHQRIYGSIRTLEYRGFNPRLIRNNGRDMFRDSLQCFNLSAEYSDSDSDY